MVGDSACNKECVRQRERERERKKKRALVSQSKKNDARTSHAQERAGRERSQRVRLRLSVPH